MIDIIFRRALLRISVVMALFLITHAENVADAAVSVFETDLSVKILIHGSIDDRTVVLFNEALANAKSTKRSVFWILLNSEGGSVDAAIEIGRTIRRSNLAVRNQGRCFSSCVLIYIAGVHRYNYQDDELNNRGKPTDSIIGLHRPYFGGASSQAMSKEAIKAMYYKVKSYIEEMGVSDRLFELIYNTPPEKMIIIRAEKIESIIPVDDPEFDEKQVQRKSIDYGLSAAEYRRRREIMRDGLKNPSSKCFINFDCIEAFYWGISESDYKKRRSQPQSLCRDLVTPAERKEFSTLDEYDRYNNAAFKRLIECRIQVMRGN